MDAVLLLSRGRRVYYGSVGGVAPYFATKLGYAMPFGMNPADFILDLANGDTSACVTGGDRATHATPTSSSFVSPAEAESPDEVVARLVKECCGQRERIDDKGNERATPSPAAAATAGDANVKSSEQDIHVNVNGTTPSPPPPLSSRWACPWWGP
jgi:hypothetical protein